MLREASLLAPMVLAASAQAGCGGGDTCIEVHAETCTPAYEPTYDNAFDNTFHPICDDEQHVCHNPTNRAGNLVFADRDQAYSLLLDGRVEPGDPGCSLVVRRIESDNPAFNMPLGDDVLEPEVRCAIEQWIAAGAERSTRRVEREHATASRERDWLTRSER